MVSLATVSLNDVIDLNINASIDLSVEELVEEAHLNVDQTWFKLFGEGPLFICQAS